MKRLPERSSSSADGSGGSIVMDPTDVWRMASRVLFVVLCSLFAVRCPSWAANEAYYNYLQGMSEERQGNTAKALEAYEKAVQQDPEALQVYRDLAELRLRIGQADAAHQAAERVKELAPKDPMSYIFLGNVRVAKGDLAGAAEAYEQALKLDPTNLRALENLGNYYALIQPEKALSYYERYLRISPRDADILFQMAVVHHKSGQLSKAEKSYKKSIELEPDQLASHLALADLYEQQKSTAAAIAEYVRATEIQAANALILTRLGNLYYRNAQFDEAWDTFQSAEKASPSDPTVHYWLARTAEEKKNWKAAAIHAEQAWDLSQDPQFLPLVAYYMTLHRQPDQAVKYLEKAKEYDPTNANILLFLGMNYMDLNKPDLAREALAKGVSLYPKDAQMRFHLGSAEDRLGNFSAAVEQFKAILEIDPNNTPAMNYLGYSWAERGENLEEAERLLRKVVAAEPESGAYLDSLGWVRFKRGDPCEAQAYLQKAIQYASDAVIFDHLGDAYMGCQHREAALQAWSKAITMDPKNQVVQNKLQQEAKKFLDSPEAKKYPLFLEGNFKQAQNLASTFSLKARLGRRKLATSGSLAYEQPDAMTLDVAATEKTAAAKFSIRGAQRQVEPPQDRCPLCQMAFDGMNTLTEFLSGRLTASLKPVLKTSGGLRTQFAKPNPSGGKDMVEVVSYDYVEGLWLPAEMRLTNATTGWSAEIQFSDWAIQPLTHAPSPP